MKTVAFTTLGCKLNYAESSELARRMEDAGFVRVEENENPDVVVFNTCTVTEVANKKSKQAIRKIINRNPETYIAVVGCYAQLKPEEVAQIEGVNLILGTENKFDVLKYLHTIDKSEQCIVINEKTSEFDFTPSYSFGDRTRSFLKVQDGCDYHCSYCTIPKARGISRSAGIIETVEAARAVVAQGVKEIILTGVNIGDFGRKKGESFLQLIKELDAIEGLQRLRISSVEPNLMSEDVINYVAQSQKIVPHFHIPLQCGTDNLLRLMRRRYTTNLYRSRVDYIKKVLPDACIAADIIVGVPGETEEEFAKTIKFVKEINISYLHVFTYSERENTPAVQMAGQVPVGERKERSNEMHRVSDEKLKQFIQEHLGTERAVLFESTHDESMMFGFTDNYIRVQVPYNESYINNIANVKLVSIHENGNVNGELI